MEKVVCQSCGMPMEKDEDFGTNEDGSKNKQYCHFCFKGGRFTDGDVTMEQKMDNMVSIAVAKGMPEDKAREIAEEKVPNLKRWCRDC